MSLSAATDIADIVRDQPDDPVAIISVHQLVGGGGALALKEGTVERYLRRDFACLNGGRSLGEWFEAIGGCKP